MLLIGRNDYWPGYTPDVIRSLDWDLWPQLALACDSLLEQRLAEKAEMDRLAASRGR